MHQFTRDMQYHNITSSSFRLHMSVQGLFSPPQNANITKRMWIHCLLISTLVSNVTCEKIADC